MTDQPKPAKRRAGAVRRSLLDAVGTPAPRQARPEQPSAPEVAVAVDVESTTPAPRKPASSPGAQRRRTTPDGGRIVKFTLELNEDEADRLDDLVRRGKRHLRQHVDKAKLMRAVLRLMADDASLRDAVFDEVGRSEAK